MELRREKAVGAVAVLAVLSIMLMSGMVAAGVGGEAGTDDEGTDVARIGDYGYSSLQAAIDATDGRTVVLLRDTSEDITVSGTVTLDLDGHRLTNVAGDTITIAIGATLTIIDGSETKAGTVDNISDGRACVLNNGTATLSAGSYLRSAEAGDANGNNGNSYYNIMNHGTMTIGEGVSVIQSGTHSSLIENGFYSYTGSDPRASHVEGVNAAEPMLTITGGTFTGGLNTIKNDDGAVVVINGGSFATSAQHALFNVNIAIVNGGTFTSPTYPLYNCSYSGGYDAGLLTIAGGGFVHGDGYADVYDASATDEGRVDLTGKGIATVQSAGSGTVTADASMDGTKGGIGAILAICTDPSTAYTIELLRDVSTTISVQAVLTIAGNGHTLTLTGDSSVGGIAISGGIAIDGKGFSLTTTAERGIFISAASASTTISVKDLVLVNGRTDRNSDGVTVSYGIIDWMAGSPGGSKAVENGYGLALIEMTISGYDSKGVYIGAAAMLDIENCAFEDAAKTWYIPSKYRTGGTVDSTDDIRNGGWDVTGGDFALQVRNFATGAEITVKDCAFTGENGRLSSIMVTQYTAQISKLSVSGCTFDRSHSTSLGDISIGKALGKDGTNAGNIANQAIARADLMAGKGGMTVVYRGDDRIDDPDTTDAKEFLSGMESNALAGFDAAPLRLYLAEGASIAAEGAWTGTSSSTVSISVTGGAEAEGAVRSGESLKGEFAISSLLLKEGAHVDAAVSSGNGGSVAFSASAGSGGMTVAYGSDGFSWSGTYSGMDALTVTGAVVLAVGSVSADIELAAAGSSVFFQKDAVYNGTVSYGESSAVFEGVSMGSDTSVSSGSVGLSGAFSSVSEGSITINGEGTVSGTVRDVSVVVASGASASVPKDGSLVVASASITVSDGATLAVDGSLITVDGASVTNQGAIDVGGTYRATTANDGRIAASVDADIAMSMISGSGTVEQAKPSASVEGSTFNATVGNAVEIPITVTKGAELLLIVTDSDGRVVDAGWIAYSDGRITATPASAGTFTVTATPHIGENIGLPASFAIVSSEPEPQHEDDGNLAQYAAIAIAVAAILCIAAYLYIRQR